MLEKIRSLLLKIAYPFNVWAGKVHLPYTIKQTWHIDNTQLSKGLAYRQPGLVYLSQTRGSFTNLLIPGEWTHAAIMGPDGQIIEAVGAGVIETDPAKFVLSKDRVVILAPKSSLAVMKSAGGKAKQQLGLKYDYSFKGGNKSFYCAELVGYSFFVSGFDFTPREMLGEKTYTAQDFYNAKNKFEVLWDSGF